MGGAGLLLDFLFGLLFFTLPNRDAFLGPSFPAVEWSDMSIVWNIIRKKAT
tara:strand:- start:466 stop:618 length:153 start_codon:yes stop_codon:yes gene_type:complete